MTRWTLVDHEWTLNGGTERTRISATLQPNGDLRISGSDSGPSVEAAYGDWDYEYWLTIKAPLVPAACAALARHALTSGSKLDWDQLCALLTSAIGPIDQGSWM